MEIIEKRGLDELLLIYSLEPELRDIYVEGKNNELIIDNFFETNSIKNNRIFPIDLIDFNNLGGNNVNIETNRKQKIIELSRQLTTKFHKKLNVVCIAEKRFDEFLGKTEENEYLIYTDFPTIESYLFEDKCLTKFSRKVLHEFPIPTKEMLIQLGHVLREIYIIWLIMYMVKLPNAPFLLQDYFGFTKICPTDGSIDFNSKDYLLKNLKSNKLMDKHQESQDLFSELNSKLIDDKKNYIIGRCFIQMLWKYQKHIIEFYPFEVDSIDRILIQCLDYTVLIKYPMFKYLNLKFN